MSRYRSKPTECEAMQWNHLGTPSGDNGAEAIVAWVNANGGEARYEPEDIQFGGMHVEDHNARIAVRTINGWAYAAPGHYVVMGHAEFEPEWDEINDPPYFVRDFYPVDPQTFKTRWKPQR